MSIENLFELDDEKYTNKKTEEIKEELESKELLEAKVKSKKRFYPDIDYSEPANFARYGLAEKYYKDSIEHIQKRYPWDGSEKELAEWRNKSSYLELYLVDNIYPSRKGSVRLNSSYVVLGADFSGSLGEEYHSSNTLQSISFKSGPNPDSSYDNASATQTFSEGSKANNIEADLDHNVKITTKGNTVEFWYKRDDSAIPSSSVCHTDIWNRKEIADPDYSRIVIESLYDSTSTEDNFYLTRVVNSSSANDRIAFTGSLDFANWHHYAFVFGVDGSAKLYIDGEETHKNETTSSFSSSYGPVVCSIGAYLKEPHESVTGSIIFESGKVGGQDCQIDDFRIWNSARTEKEIKRNWFRNVFGGTNTDESNRDLGIYYKFNEGFASNETIDSTIFDYSGRSSHAKILNYNSNPNCRSDSTPPKLQEKGDPIIYPQNSEVVSFTESMIEKAVVHDLSNHSSLYKSVPQWIRDEDEKINSSVMKNLMQIMASYLDTVHLQIENLPKIADTDLETKEESDIFIKSLLRNQGYVVPEILADAELIESISDRTESKNLEKQIKQIKDQIYRNIYNNSLFISKSKGTEKAFRNMIRCFGVDNELIKIRNYVSNSTRKLKDTNRYEATHKKNYVDFSKSQNKNGNIYQADFISGSVEIPYTFQLEAIFPYTRSQRPEIDYPIFTTSSLGGIYSCDATGAVSSSQAKISFVRDGNDGHFRLDFGDAVLTSSNFEDIYDNQRWNISLRVHDKNRDVNFMDPHTKDYEVIFSGVSVQDAEVQSSFSVSHSSASYSASLADNKKLFIGADKTNASGSVNNLSDLKITSVRFWADSLEDENLKLHAYNPSSYGHISPMERTLQNISLNPDNKDVFKKDTLLLNWDFLNNQLPVVNRVPQRDLFEPLNGIYGANDGVSTLSNTDPSVIFENIPVFGYRDDLPQYENNSDRIKITEEEDVEDRIFYFNRNTPSVEFSVEKSMSAIIDDHILNHFANLSEFNQLLSPASSREQTRYKQLEFLRRKLFTEEIRNEPDLERFLEFYKWLDNSVRDFVYQITPASSGFSKKIFNVVESSMLERSKYSAPAFVNRADSILDSSKEPELEVNTSIQPQAGGDTDTQSDGTTIVVPDTTGDTDDFASRNFTEIFSPKISFTETNRHQFSPVENLSFRNSEVRRFLDKYWTAKALFVTDAIDSSEMSYVEDTLSSSAYSIRKNATEGIKKSNYPTLRRDFPNSLLRRGDYKNFIMSGDSMLANPQVRNVTYNLEVDLDYVKISKQFDDPYADDTLRNKSHDIQTLTKMKEEISSEGDNIKSISYTQKLFPKRTKFEQASFYQNENKKSGNKSTFFREGVLNRIKQANEPNYLDWSEDIFYKPLYGQIESLWPFDHYKLEDKDTGLKVTIDGELSFKKADYYKDMLSSVAEDSKEINADKYFNLQFDRSDLSEIVFPSNLEQCNEATAKNFLAEYKEDKNTFGKSRSLFEEVDFNNILHCRYIIDEENSNNTKVILRNSLLENFEIDRKYWTELDNSVDDVNSYLTTDFTQKLENKIKLKPSAAKVNITKSPAPQLKYLYTPYGYNEFNEIKTSNYSDEYSPSNDFLAEDFEYAEVPVHSLSTNNNTGLTRRIDKQKGLFVSERTGESSYKIYNNFTKKYSKDGLGMLPVTSFSGKNMSSYDGYEHFDSSNVFVPKGGIGLENSFRLPLREVSPYNHLPGWKKLNNEPIILSGCEINSSANTNEYMQIKVDKIRRVATSEESISLQDTPFALSTWFSVDKSIYEGSSDLGIFCLSQCKESKSDAYFSVFLKQSSTNSGPLVVYLNDGETIEAAKNSSEQTDRTFYFFKDNNGVAQEISYSDIDSLSNLIFQFTPASATAPAMIKLHLNGEQLYGIQKKAYDLSAGVYYSACPVFTTDAWGNGAWGKDINHVNRIKSIKIGNASPGADAKYRFSGVVFQTSLFSGILSKSSVERIYNGGIPVNVLEQYANNKVIGIENPDDGDKEFGSKAPYLGTLPGTYGRPPYAFGVDKSDILSGLLEFCALHNLGFPSYHEPSTRSIMKNDAFWENKAYSDKLKISEVIKTFPEQNKIKTKLVTKIEANKNFVPLNGFYPLQRVAQIGELFQEAVIPSLRISAKTTPSKQLNSIMDMWSYAMFNTVRWGIEHSAPIYSNASGINGFSSFEQTEVKVTKPGDGNDSLGLTLPPLGTSSVHRNTIVPDIYLDKKSTVRYDDLFVSSVPLRNISSSKAFADLKASQPKFNVGLENFQKNLGLLICREPDETFGKEYILYPNHLFNSLKKTESSIDVGDYKIIYESHPENIFSLYGDYYCDLREDDVELKIHNTVSSSPSFSLSGMKEGAAALYQKAITNFTDSAAEFRKDKNLAKFESNIVRARFENGKTYAMRLSFSKSQNYTPVSFYDNQGRFNPGMILGSPHKFQQTKDYNYNDFTNPLSYVPHISPHYYEDEVVITYKHDLPTGEYDREEILRNVLEKRSVQYNHNEISERILASLGMTTSDVPINDFIKSSAYKNRKKIIDCIDLARVNDSGNWEISLKQEFPVIDYYEKVPASEAKLLGMEYKSPEQPDESETSGIYLQIEDVVSHESLRVALGFGTKDEATSSKICDFANSMTLGEATVTIPFVRNKMDRTTEVAGIYLLNDDFFVGTARNLETHRDKLSSYCVSSEIPLDSTLFSIAEVVHNFDRDDIINVWQNVCPKVEIENSIYNTELEFGQDFVCPENVEIEFLVFKVKKKGKYSNESYNWPHDFYSLIDTASVSYKIECEYGEE